MSQGVQGGSHRGVICLFCGKPTLLPALTERRPSANRVEPGSRASIIRCHLCSKEALYLPEEIVDLQELRTSSNAKARAVGLP